ncbi:MAG: helix-turn-helix transcriptional regulator [Christensenellaceae bacterium]
MPDRIERMQLLSIVAQRIRTERKKLNITMEKLAELSNVSLQTIKDIEYGKRACQIDTLVSIATTLKLSTDYILGFWEYTSATNQPTIDILCSVLGENERYYLYEMAKIMASSTEHYVCKRSDL